jgi:hypothetical protein
VLVSLTDLLSMTSVLWKAKEDDDASATLHLPSNLVFQALGGPP